MSKAYMIVNSNGFWEIDLKNNIVFDSVKEAKAYARRWGVAHVADYTEVEK
jgi:hypothetical protein